MKVLQITNNYPTLSLPIFGVFVKEQIDALSDIGIENEIFFVNGYEKGKFQYIKGCFQLWVHLRRHNYDLIHCHHTLAALMYILIPKKNRPCVVSFQNDPEHEHGLTLYKIIKKRFDCLIFKNNSKLITSLGSKGIYLPNGVDTTIFSPLNRVEACKTLGLDINKRYILFVSSNNMRRQKRYDIFCAVINKLRNEYGLNDIEELKLINVERNLVPIYFNASSLHLMTSDFEGSPNSVKEAMSCNIPVVSTNVGNVSDLLKNIKGCYVTNSNEIDELAQNAYLSLKDDNINSRQVIIDKGLDIKSVAIKLECIYDNVLAKKRFKS